mmetsp:Transcript_52022/g.91816  ORF Transcript_52022/g.91816 Transcript_52022/m.91816 type:complete len:273 (+) Transcript_52022:122-940(+)
MIQIGASPRARDKRNKGKCARQIQVSSRKLTTLNGAQMCSSRDVRHTRKAVASSRGLRCAFGTGPLHLLLGSERKERLERGDASPPPPDASEGGLLGRAVHAAAGAHVAPPHEELLGLPHVDVLVQLVRRRQLVRLRRLDGGVHLRAHRHLHLLELGGSRELQLEQVALRALDGVACLAHGRDLVAVAVGDARVGHGVAVVAVGVHLHHKGTIVEGVELGEASGLAHVEDVHAVDLDAGDVVAARVVVRVGGRAALARAHAVLVVLTHEEDG